MYSAATVIRTNTSDSAGGERVFRRIVEQRVDAGRQRDDAAGQPDDRLRAKQRDGVDERQQRARSTAGATSGAVIENAVRIFDAPRICAASSYDASTDCSALDASRYTNGKVCITVTSTSPAS